MRRIAILPLIALLLGVMAGPTWADGPPEVEPLEIQFDALNPCTGQDVTVSVTGTQRVHSFHNEPGDMHHINLVEVYELETSDGFSGRGTFRTAHNAEGSPRPLEDEEWGMLVQFDVGILRNPLTRQTIVFHLGAHVTYRDGEFIVLMEWSDVECRGRPT